MPFNQIHEGIPQYQWTIDTEATTIVDCVFVAGGSMEEVEGAVVADLVRRKAPASVAGDFIEQAQTRYMELSLEGIKE